MKKLINIAILSLLITSIGCGKTESNPDKNVSKKKSRYVILTKEGIEYGKFGIKDGVPFLIDGKATDALIGVGNNGLTINLMSGEVTTTSGALFIMLMKNATGVGQYTFDGLSISGFDGSGTDFTYRTDPGELNMYQYSTGEKMIRTRPSGGSCNLVGSGTFGRTEVTVTQYTDNNDGHWLFEGSFTVRLHGINDASNCISDQVINVSGYFYSEN